ncbi:hypothetical protein BGZ80_000059 [Entomortierella chlamydospora]|uniref:Thioredoxin domain-containing protein n=1 Tax=Entomortierella chlamydospora TaxID=101097 RepID=A0A9P6MTL9_9FUNG|nr:hypothetical protein BGZ79_006193 [Entomortierella chlamydospora]KAG0012308.1 hypothetical protein BGZ80_000059 [Entomortierella chlamydospora]
MFKRIKSEREFAKAINSENIAIVYFDETGSPYQTPDYTDFPKYPAYANVRFYQITIEDLYELSEREIEARPDECFIIYKNGRKIGALDIMDIQTMHRQLGEVIEKSGFERQVKKFDSVRDFNAIVASGHVLIVYFISTWQDDCYMRCDYERLANDPAFSSVEFYVSSSGNQKDIAEKAQVDVPQLYQVYKNGYKIECGSPNPESMEVSLMSAIRGADFFGSSSEITADVKSGRVVVIHFKEKKSHSCKFLSDKLEKLKRLPELFNIGVYDIDIHDQGEIAEAFQIKSAPTIFIYKDGLNISRIVGRDVRNIREMILRAAAGQSLN